MNTHAHKKLNSEYSVYYSRYVSMTLDTNNDTIFMSAVREVFADNGKWTQLTKQSKIVHIPYNTILSVSKYCQINIIY